MYYIVYGELLVFICCCLAIGPSFSSYDRPCVVTCVLYIYAFIIFEHWRHLFHAIVQSRSLLETSTCAFVVRLCLITCIHIFLNKISLQHSMLLDSVLINCICNCVLCMHEFAFMQVYVYMSLCFILMSMHACFFALWCHVICACKVILYLYHMCFLCNSRFKSSQELMLCAIDILTLNITYLIWWFVKTPFCKYMMACFLLIKKNGDKYFWHFSR